jgi:hypothetical protein
MAKTKRRLSDTERAERGHATESGCSKRRRSC